MLLLGAALAQPVSQAWSIDRWGLEDGLPQSSVNALARASDGRLWLGTFAGVAAFDGVRATPLGGDGERPLRVTSLAVEGETLWVGTELGELWTWRDGAFTLQDLDIGGSVIRDVLVNDGSLWVASDAGTWRIQGDDTSRVHEGAAWTLGAQGDAIWICAEDGVLRVKGGAAELQLEVECHDGAPVPGGYAARTAEGLDLLYEGRSHHVDLEPAELVRGPYIDPEGRMWLGQGTELWDMGPWEEVVDQDRADPQRVHEVGGNATPLLSVDGALWAGTSGEGLARIAPLGFTRLPAVVGIHGSGPLVTDARGAWFSMDCRALSHISDTQAPSPVPIPPYEECISALAHDDQGLLVAEGTRLTRRHPDGRWEILLEAPADVTLLAPGAGGLWVGDVQGGLRQLHADGTTTVEPLPVRGALLSLLEQGDTLYVGFDHGLAVRQAGRWRLFGPDEGLPQGAVRSLVSDPTGLVWVVTYGNGLGWFEDGRAGALPWGDDALPDPYLSGMGILEDGTVWLHGNGGLTRTHRDDLLAARGGDLSIPTSLLATGEANGWRRPSSGVSGDNLWLVGVHEVAVVDLGHLGPTPSAPTPRWLDVRLGDHSLLEDPAPPAETWRRLEVDYTAAALGTQPALRFAQRLRHPDGDGPWLPVGASRHGSFAELTPGDYLVEVRAQQQGGAWGPTTALAFTVAPHWYERSGVAVAGVLGLLLVVMLGGALRTRSVQAKAQRSAAREARYRQVFSRSSNAFLLYDAEGRCVDVNPRACELFGADPAALRRSSPEELGLTAERQPGSPLLCRRPDHSVFPARVDEVACPLPDGEGRLWSIVDLSALVAAHEDEARLRHELFQAQRVQALGRMAGGLAHDMNNLLSVVSMSLHQLRHHAEEASSLSAVNDAEQAIRRGVSLIRQLLALGQQSPLGGSAEVVEALEGLKPMLARLVSQQLVVQAPPEPCRVALSGSQFEQVLMNLVLNAADASPAQSTIRVRVEAGGDRVRLYVEDEGPGIPAELAGSVFDPFFSTKGSGRGLGLSSVKAIVDAAGGSISLRNEGGARWCITLPAAGPAAQPRDGETWGAPLDIVLVDDNEALLRAMLRTLPRHVTGVAYSDPRKALAEISARSEAPDLLVTDVVMPGLNGRQLANAVRERWPGMPVIFISGYTADVLGPVREDGEVLLQKPFAPGELHALMRSLVG